MISYGRQTIEPDDVEAVLEALRSDYLTQGPRVEEFEEAIASYTGARFAVACSNGTAALHLACLAAGLGPGAGVVTSPVTFIASANAALYVGATPHFADIDPLTRNIDPARIEDLLKKTPGIKALIPVHYAGLPSAMDEIREIASSRGLVVIEDACHALGAEWKDRNVWRKTGDCSRSDMTVFSFHPVKSITTAEGGAITTNSPAFYEKLKALRSHGVVKDPSRLLFGDGEGPWYYEMQYLGYNYRLPDLNSALGISQLRKLDRFIARRSEIASLYNGLLSGCGFIKTPVEPEGRRSSWHLYAVEVDFDGLRVSKAEWFRLMRESGFSPQVHYIPVHLQPYYRKKFGFKAGDFPVAESFYRKEVSLPIYPSLTDEEAGAVTEALVSSLAYAATCSARPQRSGSAA